MEKYEVDLFYKYEKYLRKLQGVDAYEFAERVAIRIEDGGQHPALAEFETFKEFERIQKNEI